MPKPRSYVRLDSRRTALFEALQELHSDFGEQYQITWESAVKLWDYIIEAERCFKSQQEWELQNAKKKVYVAISGYINRLASVDQVGKQIGQLQLLQQKARSLAAEVDECLDQHWLQPQRELEQSLSEQGQALRDDVRRQLAYEVELVSSQIQDKEDYNRLVEAAEDKAIRRIESKIVMSITKGQSSKTGKCSPEQKKIRRAVMDIINEEIQRLHRENTWKAAEPTLVEAGYSEDDLAFLECQWLAQVE